MAMYIFQELAPKVFYFTYCLQEIGQYIKHIEDSDSNPLINKNLVSNWKNENNKSVKIFSSDLKNEQKPIQGETLFLVNNLKSTFLYCFGQYKLFNNIEEEINLDTTFYIDKYYEKEFPDRESFGKYTATMYINDSFDGGSVSVGNRPAFKPEAGSIVIAPSNLEIKTDAAANNSRYIASAYWI